MELSQKYNIDPPDLVAKGSVVVGRANKSSDLDIAVVVPPLHKFCSDPKLWREYSSELASHLKTDFKIDPRLVVEEQSYSLRLLKPK